MAVFNRILNILVMIMAVLAALFSWKLYERRKEMRERGDTLAKKINEVALVLDAKTPENDKVAKNVTVQGIEAGKGSLGWINYHNTQKRTEYVGNLDKVITAAGKVAKQRDDNSGRLVKVDQRFKEHTDDLFDKYNDPAQSEATFAALETVLVEFFTRDNILVDRLIAANQFFDPSIKATRKEGRQDYASLADQLDAAIKYEQTQNQRKTATLENMAETLTKPYIGVMKEDMKDLSEVNKRTIAEKIAKIKRDLDRIVILENTIKDREDTIKEREATIADKDTEILRKNAQIGDLLEKEKNYKLKIQMQAAVIERLTKPGGGNDVGEVKYDGNILKVNYDYNYVIITFDKAKQKLPISATLTVARDREYIAKVQVTKLFKNYAVADILPHEREGEIIEGDRVLKISF